MSAAYELAELADYHEASGEPFTPAAMRQLAVKWRAQEAARFLDIETHLGEVRDAHLELKGHLDSIGPEVEVALTVAELDVKRYRSREPADRGYLLKAAACLLEAIVRHDTTTATEETR